MEREPTNRNLLWLIVASLAVWCVVMALGAYLGLDPGTPDRDWRRMGVALLAIGGFLGLWMGALWVRRRRR